MADEMVAKFKSTRLQDIHFTREGGDEYDDDESEQFSYVVTLTIDVKAGRSDKIFLDTGATKGIFGNASLLDVSRQSLQ